MILDRRAHTSYGCRFYDFETVVDAGLYFFQNMVSFVKILVFEAK